MTPNEEWGLAGKVAIVTGGGAAGDGIGNGRAACILLARAGAHVLVVDRDLTLARRTVEMIADEGGSAAAASYDVTLSEQCAAMVKDAVSRWGRLDCLDNNVGIGSKGTVVEETQENWARVMHVNVDTMFLACKHAIPEMVRTAGGGSIVNISSISALRPRGLTAYSVSKGAVIALTKSMGAELAPDKIRVNAINPVMGETGLLATLLGEDTPERRSKVVGTIPLGRLSLPSDIANAAVFFADPASAFITGVCMEVDGGRCI